MRKCDPTLARAPPLQRIDVGSIPTASTDCVRGVAATGHPPTVASRVQSPPDALDCVRAHDVTAACRLAMADVWVRLPLGALRIVAARYANRYCGQAQTLVFVGSTPTRATAASARVNMRPNGDVDQLAGVATLRTWRVWVRIPPSLLQTTVQTGRRPSGSHKPGGWVQLPGLQLNDRVGQSAEPAGREPVQCGFDSHLGH